MGAETVEQYLRRLRRLVVDGHAAADVIAAVTAVLADERGVTVPFGGHVRGGVAPGIVAPPAGLGSPWLLGSVHEALLEPGARHRAGAHYTPASVARGLVDFALDDLGAVPEAVCDPSVGGGAFLLAAAERLASADGGDPARVVAGRCFGIDVDPVAVSVTRASLALWAGEWLPELEANIVVADALDDTRWAGRFDLVIGNPPFQNQLGAGTARSREVAARLRARYGDAAGGYVDTAALFLLRAIELASPGGRVALVQPHSTLTARDARGARDAVLARAELTGLWFAEDPVFRAGVRVWAPVLDIGRAGSTVPGVRRCTGGAFTPAPPACPMPDPPPASWAAVVADLAGLPSVGHAGTSRVGAVATATAGFRAQYYGLVGAVEEEPDPGGVPAGPRLVTSGLVDVLRLEWGRRPARFARARYARPTVRLELVDPAIEPWVRARLVPKLLVATQTRVLEVVVDETGELLPCTPVIAVHAPPERLWHLAAALSAPPVTVLARQASIGAALSAEALKLSARQVLELPLPSDPAAWDDAAALARAAAGEADEDARLVCLERFGRAACAAYRVPPEEVLAWWLERIS